MACPAVHQTLVLHGLHAPPLAPWNPPRHTQLPAYVDPETELELEGHARQPETSPSPSVDEYFPEAHCGQVDEDVAAEAVEY